MRILAANILLDREKVTQPGDWQKAQGYIRQIIADPPTPHVTKRLLTQIIPLPRSLYTLVGQFAGAIHPTVPDVEIIWGLVELNIKVRLRAILHRPCIAEQVKVIMYLPREAHPDRGLDEKTTWCGRALQQVS